MTSPAAKLALARAWAAKDAAAKAAKAEADKAREVAVEACFPEGVKQGTNTAELPEGCALKAVVRPNPKLDELKLNEALELMRTDGKLGPELAKRLVKHKPELQLREWDQLPDDYRAIVAPAVTITLSTPSLELKAPR